MAVQASVGTQHKTITNKLWRVLHSPQFWFAFPWIVVTLVYYAMFHYVPMFRAIPMAMLRYNIMEPAKSQFIGFNNFTVMMMNPNFWPSIQHTLEWVVLMTVMQLPLALFLAVLLTNLERMRNFFQTISFIPVVCSMAAISLLFRMLMDPYTGQFNQILTGLGLGKFPWLTDARTSLFSIALIATWKGVGSYVVVFTAGILGIPKEMYEAALVDGASSWQRFWRITLPLLSHQSTLITVTLAIGAMQEFGLPYMMTGGGPGVSTLLYNLLIYNEAFQSFRFGTASAGALILWVAVLAISILRLNVFKPDWQY